MEAHGEHGAIEVSLACRWHESRTKELTLEVWKLRTGKDWQLLSSTTQPTKQAPEGKCVGLDFKQTIEYWFHSPTHLKIVVGREPSKRRRSLTSRGDHGEATFNLATLETGETLGSIDILGNEKSNTRDIVCLYFRARKLIKAGDAALAISAWNEELGGWDQVGRTEFVFGTVLGTTEPIWRPLRVPVRHLCDQENQRLRIDCLLNSSFTGPYSIGYCEVTLPELLSATKETSFKLTASDRSVAGTINMLHYHFTKRYSFLDYVSGGCEIKLVLAIDFTASNGDPSKKTSLHYVGGASPNQYELAIRAIAEPLAYYCSSKQILAYGYGAETPCSRNVSHCFPLTFDESKPETKGVEGLLDVYKAALQQVKLRGPTHFAPIIEKASCYAANGPAGEGQSHLVLLFITDGIINDMEETELKLDEASALPLSILIVGVGDADFTNMDILCEQHKNVRFIPMADFIDRPVEDLSEELLKGIPDQLTEYMYANALQPVQLPPTSLPEMIERFQQAKEDQGSDQEDDEAVRTEPPAWQDDQATSNCTRCKSEFTLLWRRHHCRYCGGIFCDTCSQYHSRIPFSPDPTPQRVCDECYASLIRIHYPCK